MQLQEENLISKLAKYTDLFSNSQICRYLNIPELALVYYKPRLNAQLRTCKFLEISGTPAFSKLRYDINKFYLYIIDMDHRQEKRKLRNRSAGRPGESHGYNTLNILFLALLLSDSSVTHYTSTRYKAEFRNALHIIIT